MLNYKYVIFLNKQNLEFKIVVESFFSLIIYVSRCIMFKNFILFILSAFFNNMLCTIIKYCTFDIHSKQ